MINVLRLEKKKHDNLIAVLLTVNERENADAIILVLFPVGWIKRMATVIT